MIDQQELKAALAAIFAPKQEAFGFHKQTNRNRGVYVGRNKLEDGTDSFFYHVGAEGKLELLEGECFTGYITDIQHSEREYKGKMNQKLRIYVKADEQYFIEVGAESTFGRGFMNAVLRVEKDKMLGQITLKAVPSDTEEKVIFCELFIGGSKVLTTGGWLKDEPLELLAQVQAHLGYTQRVYDNDKVAPKTQAKAAPSQAAPQKATEPKSPASNLSDHAKWTLDTLNAAGVAENMRLVVVEGLTGIKTQSVPNIPIATAKLLRTALKQNPNAIAEMLAAAKDAQEEFGDEENPFSDDDF